MLRPDEPTSVPPPPGGGGRRERNAAATQGKLLDAAEREFARQGFAGARLREIAAGAGVQPALIHHYFTDKSGLYRAVLDRLLAKTHDESWRVLGEARDLPGLVAGFVDVLVGFYADNQSFVAILRHEALDQSSVCMDVIRDRSRPLFEAVRLVLVEKQRTGAVRADVDATAMLVAALSIVAFPFGEAAMVEALIPGAVPRDEASIERWKRGITALLLSSLRPG